MIDLSIIIVNFNTKKLLKDCVDSVVKNTKNIDYEIIVVDNASTDGSFEMVAELARKFRIIKLVRNRKNLGFARANNRGLKIARGRYILLLNSDTIIKDNVLGEITSWMDTHPKVGVATCALRNTDGSLQGTGGYFPNLFRVFAWMFFLEDMPVIDRLIRPFHPMHPNSPFYKGEVFFKKPHERDWVTGAFFLIRRKVVEEVGLIDEDYFMYVEEVDYCWRVKKAGWQVWFLPQWSVVHLGGASSAKEFPILSEFAGIKIFYKKNKPAWQMPILKLILKGGIMARMVLFNLLGRKEVSEIYVKAISKI